MDVTNFSALYLIPYAALLAVHFFVDRRLAHLESNSTLEALDAVQVVVAFLLSCLLLYFSGREGQPGRFTLGKYSSIAAIAGTYLVSCHVSGILTAVNNSELRVVSAMHYLRVGSVIACTVCLNGLRPLKTWFLVIIGGVPLLFQPLALLVPSTWEARNITSFSYHLAIEIVGYTLSMAISLVWSYRSFAVSRASHAIRDTLLQKAARAQSLLEAAMPPPIARELLAGTPAFELSQSYNSVSIVFISLVDFRLKEAEGDPRALMAWLNCIYAAFDGLVDAYAERITKIEVVANTYVVAVGLPIENPFHSVLAACFSVDLLDLCEHVPGVGRVNIRIGVNSGPVAAGLVGLTRRFFRIVGDTVNVASRMMSTGVDGLIHCSPTSAAGMLANNVEVHGLTLEPRGTVEVKGKGAMETFWLRRADPSAADRSSTPTTLGDPASVISPRNITLCRSGPPEQSQEAPIGASPAPLPSIVVFSPPQPVDSSATGPDISTSKVTTLDPITERSVAVLPPPNLHIRIHRGGSDPHPESKLHEMRHPPGLIATPLPDDQLLHMSALSQQANRDATGVPRMDRARIPRPVQAECIVSHVSSSGDYRLDVQNTLHPDSSGDYHREAQTLGTPRAKYPRSLARVQALLDGSEQRLTSSQRSLPRIASHYVAQAVGATASNSEYLCNTYTPQTIRCDENGRSVMLPGLTQSPVLRSQHEAESMRGLNGLTLLQKGAWLDKEHLAQAIPVRKATASRSPLAPQSGCANKSLAQSQQPSAHTLITELPMVSLHNAPEALTAPFSTPSTTLVERDMEPNESPVTPCKSPTSKGSATSHKQHTNATELDGLQRPWAGITANEPTSVEQRISTMPRSSFLLRSVLNASGRRGAPSLHRDVSIDDVVDIVADERFEASSDRASVLSRRIPVVVMPAASVASFSTSRTMPAKDTPVQVARTPSPTRSEATSDSHHPIQDPAAFLVVVGISSFFRQLAPPLFPDLGVEATFSEELGQSAARHAALCFSMTFFGFVVYNVLSPVIHEGASPQIAMSILGTIAVGCLAGFSRSLITEPIKRSRWLRVPNAALWMVACLVVCLYVIEAVDLAVCTMGWTQEDSLIAREEGFRWRVLWLSLTCAATPLVRLPFRQTTFFHVIAVVVDLVFVVQQGLYYRLSSDIPIIMFAHLIVIHVIILVSSHVFETGERGIFAIQSAIHVAEKDATSLLSNLFPDPIVGMLTQGEAVSPQVSNDTAILYADLAGFTQLSSEMSASDLMGVLNLMYARFDALVEEAGLWKVETVGDAYIVVGGIAALTRSPQDGGPLRSPLVDPQNSSSGSHSQLTAVRSHLDKVFHLAVRMLDELSQLRKDLGLPLHMRIGVHCGDVVTGIVGSQRPRFCVLGQAVSEAEKIEEAGGLDNVTCTGEALRRYLASSFVFTPATTAQSSASSIALSPPFHPASVGLPHSKDKFNVSLHAGSSIESGTSVLTASLSENVPMDSKGSESRANTLSATGNRL